MQNQTSESTVRSQDDLARVAGVTRMTVFRALSGQPGVGQKTRQRIQNLARELGYRPNAAARSIRSGRFHAIGLLRESAPEPGWLSIGAQSEIEREADLHDMHVVQGLIPNRDIRQPRRLPRLLRELSVDGLLVVFSRSVPKLVLETAQRLHLPLIWLNLKVGNDCVYPDDLGAGRRGTEHLLSLGHRRIAFPMQPESRHYSSTDRFEGYRQAMVAAGQTPVSVPWNPQENQYPVARQLLEGPDRPTALLIQFNPVDVLFAARDLGLRVPEDLSVIVMRDPSFCHVWAESPWIGGVEMTALEIPAHEMGRRSVQMLIQKARSPEVELPGETLAFEFVRGASCAPPRQ